MIVPDYTPWIVWLPSALLYNANWLQHLFVVSSWTRLMFVFDVHAEHNIDNAMFQGYTYRMLWVWLVW